MTKPITDEILKEILTPEQWEEYQEAIEVFGKSEANFALPYLGDEYYESDGKVFSLVNSRIKELRLEHGLTQVELANVLRVSQREYWRYEQDGYSLGIFKLTLIAMFYNVSIDWFTGLTDTKRPIKDNTKIFEANWVNGYSLKEMKEAKSRGVKYEPHRFDEEE